MVEQKSEQRKMAKHCKMFKCSHINSSKTPFFNHKTSKDLFKMIIFMLAGFSETPVPFWLQYTINESNLSAGQYASIPLK